MTSISTTTDQIAAPTTSSLQQPRAKRLSGVDGLRGLAALIVVIYHSYNESGAPDWRPLYHVNVLRPLHDGWAAVNLFLVLSGFCLYWPFAIRPDKPQRQLNITDYAMRRTMRIVPTYYASLVFVALLALFTPLRQSGHSFLPFAWWDALDHLLLLNAWIPASIYSWSGVAWSLSLEWTWYAAFPLALYLFRRQGPIRGMLVLTTIMVVYRLGLYAWWGPSSKYSTNVQFAARAFLPGRLFEFGAGMFVAAFAAAHVPVPRRTNIMGPVAIIVALVASHLAESVDPFLPVRDFLYGTASAILLFMVVVPNSGLIKRLSEHVVLVWIGEFSYTLYLFHLAFVTAGVIYLKAHGLDNTRLFTASLIFLPLILVACWAYIS